MVVLDLRVHEVVIEHSGGGSERVPLTPDRAVGTVTGEVLAAVGKVAGPVQIDPTPQEVTWSAPLDQTASTPRMTRTGCRTTSQPRRRPPWSWPRSGLRIAAGQRRSTPGGALSTWPGLVLRPAGRPTIRRFHHAQRHGRRKRLPSAGGREMPATARPRVYAYAHPAPPGFDQMTLTPPPARWDSALGEYLLDWDDVRASTDPHGAGFEFARSAFRHACAVCGWDDALAASVEGQPPPIV